MLMATIYKSIFIRPIPLLKLIGTKFNDSLVIDKQLVESDDTKESTHTNTMSVDLDKKYDEAIL